MPALVVMVGSVVTALLALPGLTMFARAETAVIALFGGCVAALGGAVLTHLIHRASPRLPSRHD